MPTQTEIAKGYNKGAGEYPLNHRLVIAGEEFSEDLISATVTYNTDVGGSGIELSVFGDELLDYVNADLQFWIGYGEDITPYFVGKISRVKQGETSQTVDVTAFGPFRQLVGQILRRNDSFFGKTLEWLIMECHALGGVDLDKISIVGARKYRVPAGEQFTYEADLSEIVTSSLENADFVGMDRKGGRRLFQPRPLAGINTAYKTMYEPHQYIDFTVEPKDEEQYYSVLIYRRNENGMDLFRIEQEVDPFVKFPPHRNKVMVVSDFPGNATEAGERAYALANNLREGESSFNLTIPINTDLDLYDGLRITNFRNRRDNKTIESRTYACTIDNEIVLNYSAGESNMTVGGTAMEIKREREILDREKPYRQPNGNIIVTNKVDADWLSWGDTEYTFEQIDKTFEELR